ncbi:hypothetical protein ACVW0J_004201 [Bradyrhizobium sp. i1.7.7]
MRSLWLPSRRRSCPLSLPHRPRRRSAHRGSADASGRRLEGAENSSIIELEINGVAVRVGRGADAATIAAVIHALKTCT